MGAKLDLTGKRFDRLTVIEFAGISRTKSGISKRNWRCQCDCGNSIVTTAAPLKSGNTGSCGCKHKELASSANRTHGGTSSKEYLGWLHIKDRVFNPNNRHFDTYSGLGMCEDWKNDFTAFLTVIGPCPGQSREWSVGRIDNDVGYFDGNIRWELPDQQSRNHSMQSNNTSGVTGVKWYTKDGVRLSCEATCNGLDGKRIGRKFSVSKYGEEQAFRLACIARKEMLDKLQEQGADYGEKHGLKRELK